MSPNLTSRTALLTPSMTLAITARAAELRAGGVDVINLSVGEPDFPTPRRVKEAGIRAIREDFTHYTAAAGIRELREAICAKLKRDNGLEYTVEQIVAGNGAKHILSSLLLAVAGPGDEVLIPRPSFLAYPEMVRIAGAEPVFLPTRVEDHWRIDPEALAAAITPRTRAVILCSPGNPTGAAYTPEEIRALGAVLRERDLWVISDEIYEKLRYDGRPHLSFAAVEGLYEKTAVVNGVSKYYAMTGWRLGYAAAPRELARAVATIQGQMTSSASSISQRAALQALTGPGGEPEEMVAAFARRRKLMADLLSGLPGAATAPIEGAFYAFPKVSGYYGRSFAGRRIEGSVALCDYLLETRHLALVPGAVFGADDHIRLSFAASEEEIREGVARLAEGLAALA